MSEFRSSVTAFGGSERGFIWHFGAFHCINCGEGGNIVLMKRKKNKHSRMIIQKKATYLEFYVWRTHTHTLYQSILSINGCYRKWYRRNVTLFDWIRDTPHIFTTNFIYLFIYTRVVPLLPFFSFIRRISERCFIALHARLINISYFLLTRILICLVALFVVNLSELLKAAGSYKPNY